MSLWTKLFGGPRRETPGNEVEALMRKVGETFYDSLYGIASDFVPVVTREAKSRGLDPLYLIYLIFTKYPRWSKLVGKDYLAMKAMRDTANDWSNDIPDYDDFKLPADDQQRDVDAALKAIAKWANSEWKEDAVKLYRAAALKYLRDADYYMKDKHEKQLSQKQLLCFIYGEMQYLTENKMALWPRYGLLLSQFTLRLFRKNVETSCPI